MMRDGGMLRLCSQLVRLATRANLTLGTAESCTGGLVCAALTDVPGSSVVVKGGVVSYAVEVKETLLGVSPAITQDPSIGVVSGECASAMASGTRRALACDVAVSTTGIAGPGGAEPGKPVGTVWFAVSSRRGCKSEVKHFDGSRDEVRHQAVLCAVKLLLAEVRSLSES